LILGGTLLLFLYLQRTDLLYVYICIIAFEGLTNWRIPILISKVRYGYASRDTAEAAVGTYRYNFESERALRLAVAVCLVVFVLFPKGLWFFPWLLGFVLTMGAMTGICPGAIFFKKLGFK
jgi:hypothetical protein